MKCSRIAALPTQSMEVPAFHWQHPAASGLGRVALVGDGSADGRQVNVWPPMAMGVLVDWGCSVASGCVPPDADVRSARAIDA